MTSLCIWAVGVVAMPWPARVGNEATNEVCKRNNKPAYCWLPPKSNQKWNYTDFWKRQPPFDLAAHGDKVVFHLRCGDILNGKHKVYQLACNECFYSLKAWFKNATSALLIAAGHGSDSERDGLCGALAHHYSMVIRNFIHRVSVEFVNDAEHDWNQLHHARKVVAIVPSSFPFSAKVGYLDELKILGRRSQIPWVHPCNHTVAEPWSAALKTKLDTC